MNLDAKKIDLIQLLCMKKDKDKKQHFTKKFSYIQLNCVIVFSIWLLHMQV